MAFSEQRAVSVLNSQFNSHSNAHFMEILSEDMPTELDRALSTQAVQLKVTYERFQADLEARVEAMRAQVEEREREREKLRQREAQVKHSRHRAS